LSSAGTHPGLDVHIYVCARCGTFEAEGVAVDAFRNHVRGGWPGNAYLLSGRARNASEAGRVELFVLNDFGKAGRADGSSSATATLVDGSGGGAGGSGKDPA